MGDDVTEAAVHAVTSTASYFLGWPLGVAICAVLVAIAAVCGCRWVTAKRQGSATGTLTNHTLICPSGPPHGGLLVAQGHQHWVNYSASHLADEGYDTLQSVAVDTSARRLYFVDFVDVKPARLTMAEGDEGERGSVGSAARLMMAEGGEGERGSVGSAARLMMAEGGEGERGSVGSAARLMMAEGGEGERGSVGSAASAQPRSAGTPDTLSSLPSLSSYSDSSPRGVRLIINDAQNEMEDVRTRSVLSSSMDLKANREETIHNWLGLSQLAPVFNRSSDMLMVGGPGPGQNVGIGDDVSTSPVLSLWSTGRSRDSGGSDSGAECGDPEDFD